ncbi:MAG: LysM peptidoglycan-binding domain-containing protein [Bacillota bacterium]
MLIHVVRPGDTFYSIARRYGVSVQTVAAANRGVDPAALRVGQRLLVPHPTPLAVAEVVRHAVQPGDTLWSVAWRYGVPTSVIILANRLEPPYPLQVGEVLLIPMAVAS